LDFVGPFSEAAAVPPTPLLNARAIEIAALADPARWRTLVSSAERRHFLSSSAGRRGPLILHVPHGEDFPSRGACRRTLLEQRWLDAPRFEADSEFRGANPGICVPAVQKRVSWQNESDEHKWWGRFPQCRRLLLQVESMNPAPERERPLTFGESRPGPRSWESAVASGLRRWTCFERRLLSTMRRVSNGRAFPCIV
jgi:hypothetical protein